MFYVYWIQSGNTRCYFGATVNPTRRLKQHNMELVGGAFRTRNKGPWHFHCVISGFRTWKEALMFEWAIKFYCKRCRSIKSREDTLKMLMEKEQWTKNSPLRHRV